ncbi:MAG: BatA and WFA domain-containing protein [Anaerolineales bacterium]|nr:BatA and WFA domain-containing protein [Anaerolineales bacterium]
MNLLSPIFLLLGLIALPILLLYMLKLRRRQVEVSSTLLWQALLRDRQANTPWQRLRRSLLLLLQLLILAALILALARPAIPSPSVAAGSVIILLDASASMNTIDVSPSRFESARSAAHTLVDNLSGDDRMTIILVGRQPLILASSENDKLSLRRAIDSASVTSGKADWQAAFALAASAAAVTSSSTKNDRVTIVILSDGGLPDESLPPLPGEVRYVSIGVSGENLAISALALRSTGSGAELFASISNFGQAERQAILSLYVGGALFSAQQVSVPGGESLPVIFTGLSQSPAIYQAQLSDPARPNQPLDALSLDDVAYASYQPPRTGRTLLISPGNFFLEQVLTAMPGVVPFRALPDEQGGFKLTSDPFDLYVFDGTWPIGEELPSGSLLLINPPSNPLFDISGSLDISTGSQIMQHPLTQFVDWGNVHIAKASQIEPPVWAETLVQAQGKPLIFAGQASGRRIAVFAFDLHDSDLPLQVAFPILFANLISYLLPSQAFDAPNGLRPGESLSIMPGPDTTQIAIASPSGKVYSLLPEESGALFTETGELGVYAVNYLGANQSQADFFAVNLFDPYESNIQPSASIQVGRAAIASSSEDRLSLREIWPWLAAIALCVLMLEWWVYHRRSTPQSTTQKHAHPHPFTPASRSGQ